MSDFSLFQPTEFKFASDGEPGVFEGYGSVFDNLDSHGDIVRPGAFAESLAQHRKAGTMPGLYAEHSAFSGGDPLPIGKWMEISEDANGLRVKGKLSALDTDHGRRVRSLMQDGVMRGLSIVYRVPPGGAERPKSGEVNRILHKVDLRAVDVVTNPSNPRAVITAMKREAGHFESKSDLMDWLHGAGLPFIYAKKLVNGGWDAVSRNFDDAEDQALKDLLRSRCSRLPTLNHR